MQSNFMECGGNWGVRAILDQVINKIYAFIAPKILAAMA
jgi:hypothetical protein